MGYRPMFLKTSWAGSPCHASMRFRENLFFALLLIVFGVFLVWPIARVLQVAFFGTGEGGKAGTFTLAYVAGVFRDHEFRTGLLNSATIAVSVTLLCLLI